MDSLYSKMWLFLLKFILQSWCAFSEQGIPDIHRILQDYGSWRSIGDWTKKGA